MRQEFVQSLLSQLKELASDDERNRQRSHEELTAAQEALARAELTASQSGARAEASRRAVQTAQKLLERAPGQQCGSDAADDQTEQVPSIVQLISSCVREREVATTLEIVKHVEKQRPGTGRGSVSPEITKMVKQGKLLRVDDATYRMGPDAKDGEDRPA